ncbi:MULTISPECIES: aldo/keto reductase [unclassified Oceanispirochaeta]|uniref:aldo/keto reductase n=1 Tax=unclassified Oceanispirochaeta TaxID=2635722 RepID=UPI000E09DECC|nr:MULTISPECIES: aldo/keto reductase [unclassified Oceanispirochaeta]MBF9018870.1 aldo/keto reductase [Oceanispirochaeta sp. M2]NPD75358.1 aldo/keto reductase [Oceanispirochaeta sp. M1]RDG28786.1 aldo/keto reductase [Oceanispirochaeta sp. M1]
MKNIKIGNKGISSSELCLGTMYFGIKVPEDESFRLMDYYYDQGGRFYDTANKYATWIPGFPEPVGELMLGRWIKSRSNRADVQIATKMGFPYGVVPLGLKKELIIQEVDKSLKRLGVEQIDLLYAHTDDYDTPQEEYMEAFDSVVKSGKVKALGSSNFYAWRMAAANEIAEKNGWTPFSCTQAKLSVLWPKVNANFGRQLPVTAEMLDYCKVQDIALLCYSPLLQGFFGRTDRDMPADYDTPQNNEILNYFRDAAADMNVSANTLVLSWMREQGMIPLITGSSLQQIKENIDSLDYSLSKEISDKIAGLYYPHRE